MIKQKLTLNEEISKVKGMMRKLINEYANLHLHDAIIEKIDELLEKMILNKLNVTSLYDIVPDSKNYVYHDDGRLISKGEKPPHSDLEDEYNELIENFDTMNLADEIFDKIKNNYDKYEIKTWNGRPVPSDAISYAEEKIKEYLDSRTFNNDKF